MNQQHKKMINEIIKNFDWIKVQKCMEYLKWEWAGAISEDRIPTIGEIVIQAKNLMEDAIKRKATIATGGLKASYEDDYLTLEFVLTSYETDREEIDNDNEDLWYK